MEDQVLKMDSRILRWRGALDRLVASHVRVDRAGAEVARQEAELPNAARWFEGVDQLHAFTEDYEARDRRLAQARADLVELEGEHLKVSEACRFIPEGASLLHPYGERVYQIKRLKPPSKDHAQGREEEFSGADERAEFGEASDESDRAGATDDVPNFKITVKDAGQAGAGDGESLAGGEGVSQPRAEEAFGPPEPTIAERLAGQRSDRGPGRRRQRLRQQQNSETAAAEGVSPNPGGGDRAGTGAP